uniref:Uncharacterized protein n=1 Tax=Ananas comosus var. bracteatus TaxID=296719 RepID=A0A6V7NP50_ANACO|nr:unnamed protein product [Ananas comosus var. bracteatus]
MEVASAMGSEKSLEISSSDSFIENDPLPSPSPSFPRNPPPRPGNPLLPIPCAQVGVRSSSSSSSFPAAQGEFGGNRMGWERDRKFAAWVGGSDSAVVEILDRSEISHPFSSNPVVSYRYAAGRRTALLLERHASCLASSHLLHSRDGANR